MTDTCDYEQAHKDMLLPVVRIRAGNAGGSGTILYSRDDAEGTGGYSTYVLTNHHVVDNMIKVVEKWSTLLKRNVKIDEMGVPEVQLFTYRYSSRTVGAQSIEADIVAYDRDEDLALLKLRSDGPVPAVATMFPRGQETNLRVFTPVVAVGA